MDVGSKLKSLIPNSQFAADKPYMFNCFKYEADGLVNRTFLNLLNIRDEELI